MTPGPCRAWFRLRVPVVAGEDPTPAQFAMVVADSGNGAGSALQFGRYGFVNPELSVHLARQPRGEWLCLDAGTVLGDAGAAVADSRLWDGGGLVGTSTQGLLVEQV
jgi:hypothetical protein